MALERLADKTKQSVQALNRLEANNDLRRQAEEIQWQEGYIPDCLSGKENIYLLPESMGDAPGDPVPLRLKTSDGRTTVIDGPKGDDHPNGFGWQ